MGKQEQNTGNSTLSPTETRRAQAGKKLNALSTLVFYLAILFFIIGFNFTDVPPGPFWYQQFMPNLNGRNITDIIFIDSLTGWSVTNALNQNPDTTYVLKTTDSGNSWAIQYRKVQTGGGFPGYFRIYFLNQNTGYTCGVAGIDKSTDGGASWTSLNAPLTSYLDMSVLNVNTIWAVSSDPVIGGVYFTSNGGANWIQQYYLINQNPDHIYMINARIGFISNVSAGTPKIRNTIDGGLSWNVIVNNRAFGDMFFTDSLNGWSEWDSVRATTDGGTTWRTQILPYAPGISALYTTRFSGINRDTIWLGGGRIIYPNSQARGVLFRTTNGGSNWLFQIPDTSIHTGIFNNTKFVDKFRGWAYSPLGGIHTTNGGDTTFYTGIRQLSGEVPKGYNLFQNYPNPFNPVTNIKYEIKRQTSNVRLIVYDITGREIIILVNQRQNAGTYIVDFSGNGLASGVYFYKLFIGDRKEEYTATKKMILLK